MPTPYTLHTLLTDSDDALRAVIARVWQINIQNQKPPQAIKTLEKEMIDTAQAEAVWATLADDQRMALQTLLSSSGGKMPTPMFERLYGKVRKMGAGQIEREKPLEKPNSIAEALYYRGLIGMAFEQVDQKGTISVTYVPSDLAAVLPTHKTAYENLEPDDQSDGEESRGELQLEPVEDVGEVRPADTSIVDDMTTLLAYLRIYSATLDGDTFAEQDAEAILPHLIVPDELRLDFLLGLAVSAELAHVQEGKIYTRREIATWLSQPRAVQLHRLVESWRGSTLYRELWHVPGLFPETDAGELASYNPAIGRSAALKVMADIVPLQDWWSVGDFIDTLKEIDPDFQRPGGDYESWYIRNEDDEYLRGYESWDAVEGALLEFMISGPLHWLGLVDIGDDAARLTAYGRAFLANTQWPTPADPEDKIVLQPDGNLLISRKISRADRFQVARFTTWTGTPTNRDEPYHYKLDAEGIKRAGEQGITTAQIGTFIKRILGDAPMPQAVGKLLETWQSGPASSVTVERLLVLRTTSTETMDFINDTPALRRYLGARLGPMAAVVRPDQWEGLKAALGERGIDAEFVGD